MDSGTTPMSKNVSIGGLVWDLGAVEAVEASQRWILSAMTKHGEGLVTMLWRILGNEQDVCDAYQQTFLRLAHNENQRKPKNIQAYLYRTAANVAITAIRNRKMRQKSFDVMANAAPRSESIDYANDLDAKQLQAKLRNAVAQLPEYLRNVVTLHDLGELTYTEVAKVLDISPPTARVYRARAVALLASIMSKERMSR
jgi:RNA polymerase sigma-70 factor (ECF subfamily)